MKKNDNLLRLKNKESKLAILGLCDKSESLAKQLSHDIEVIIHDSNEFTQKGGLFSKSKKVDYNNASALKQASVFLFCNSASSANHWDSLKAFAKEVGDHLKPGDWVVFSNSIDPNMAEIVLLPILEKRSIMRVGMGFEVAFLPAKNEMANFASLSNLLKLSHNLIIEKVAGIFKLNTQNPNTLRIDFSDETRQLMRIKNSVARSWIPVLNKMDKAVFQRFFDACVNDGFLNAYEDLKLAREEKTNFQRFFAMANEMGLKHKFNKEIFNALKIAS